MVWNKSKILDLFVKGKMRMEIGIGWLYYPRQFALVFIGMIWLLDRFQYSPTLVQLSIIGLVGFVLVFLLGHIDLTWLGVYARQQGLQMGTYNDYLPKALSKARKL